MNIYSIAFEPTQSMFCEKM